MTAKDAPHGNLAPGIFTLPAMASLLLVGILKRNRARILASP